MFLRDEESDSVTVEVGVEVLYLIGECFGLVCALTNFFKQGKNLLAQLGTGVGQPLVIEVHSGGYPCHKTFLNVLIACEHAFPKLR